MFTFIRHLFLAWTLAVLATYAIDPEGIMWFLVGYYGGIAALVITTFKVSCAIIDSFVEGADEVEQEEELTVVFDFTEEYYAEILQQAEADGEDMDDARRVVDHLRNGRLLILKSDYDGAVEFIREILLTKGHPLPYAVRESKARVDLLLEGREETSVALDHLAA